MRRKRIGTAGGRCCRIGTGGSQMGILTKPKPLKKTRMTVREFLALPPDEHCRTELIYGEMIVMPKPREKHNRLLHNLGEMLRRWLRHMKLGQICFDIDMI